ncbi:flagellar protein FliT [Porticoccus sp. W117]|uniref:flagellar protein FliT n=1 Tax=Porticoccus sp. W117 TaxID=3054777 RepID=UPI00259A3BF1|nr:flagellar protein FliT [Porticoccus sp. W117]MDM3871010.1 flagellar protein FliT [Porticoccus sp. W117]
MKNSAITTTDSQRQARIQSVLSLSREMLAAAENGDWQQFAELEKSRRRDMLACFEQPVAAVEANAVRQGIEQLMAVNDQLTQCLQNAREQSARQFQALRQGQRAVGAYATG